MIEEDPLHGSGEDAGTGATPVRRIRGGGEFQRRALRALHAYPAGTLEELHGDEYLDNTFDPERRAELADLRALLEERLSELPPRYGQIVRMRILEGLQPREVAEELGIPAETVRTRTRRGLALLKLSVGSRLPDDPLAPRRPLLGILAFPWFRRGTGSRALAGGAACASLGIFAVFASWLHGTPQEAALPDEGRAAEQAAAPGALTRTERVALAVTPEATALVKIRPAPAVHVAEAFQVSIKHPDTTPASGAALFGFDRLDRPGVLLGTADDAGEVEIVTRPDTRWLAARGAPGEISDALLLNQPGHTTTGTVDLTLESVDVAWIRVATPTGGVEPSALTMAARPMDERFAVHATARDGVRAAPTAVPAWRRDEAGGQVFGLPWGDVPKRLTLWRNSQLFWTSETFDVFDDPPTEVTVQPTWSLQGRIISADGLPAPGVQVYVHDTGTTRHTGAELTTGVDGSFALAHLSEEAMAITIRGLHTVLVRAPEDGVDEGRVDVGDMALPEAEGESRRLVHVLGSLPGDELWGLRFGAVHAWPGQRLAYPEGKRARLERAELDHYVAPEDLNSYVAIALLRKGHAPLIVLRPTETWLRQIVTLDAREIPAAQVVGTIPLEMLPAKVQYTHLATGFALSDSVGRSRSGAFTSRPLPPGHWDVSVQGVDGTVARRRAVELAAERTVDVGSIAPACGHMELTWPNDVPTGATCSLIYMRSGVPVAFETRTIGEPVRSPDLEPGSYVVHVAARDGTWLAHGDVLREQTTTAALDGESHVIGLLMGPTRRSHIPSNATFEIFDSKGELIRVITGKDLAPTGKLQWVVPTRDVARLRSTVNGLVYESRPLRRRSPDRAVFNVMKGRGVTRVR